MRAYSGEKRNMLENCHILTNATIYSSSYKSASLRAASRLLWTALRMGKRNTGSFKSPPARTQYHATDPQHKMSAPRHLLLCWNWKLLTEIFPWTLLTSKKKTGRWEHKPGRKNKPFSCKSPHLERGNLQAGLINTITRRWYQISIWNFQ